MAIRVLSFDFDGCLFHTACRSSPLKGVVAQNQNFLDLIKTENKQFSKVITFVGSNRQSKDVDDVNAIAWGRGSCFPAIIEVSEVLSATLDRFLLADVYGGLRDGESFARAIQSDTGSSGSSGSPGSPVAHADWLFDETKVTILYAQMHKIAMENPTTEIVFEFYDDRGCGKRRLVDILEWLKTFYETHHVLIPKNVTLRLNHYAGNTVTKTSEIKGTGEIDENFRETVKEMAEQTRNVPGGVDWEGKYLIAHHVNPTALKSRIPITVTQSINVKDSSIGAGDLILFRMQLEKIKAKSVQLASEKHVSAAKKVNEMYISMNDALTSYLKKPDIEAFKKECLEAFIRAHQDGELEQHRGWKECLVNLIAALSVIGIIVKGLINYYQNRSFFFVAKTDSAALLDETKKMVVEMTP